MRVFVTGTGRCGTKTFAEACRHITNYTAAHESHWGAGYVPRMIYPDNHIEVAPQLVLWIPQLRRRHPDALWVHLIRVNRAACVASLASRCRRSMLAFAWQWFGLELEEPTVAAGVFYDAINELCAQLMPANRLTLMVRERSGLPLEESLEFWRRTGAIGDPNAFVTEWRTRHNARRQPQPSEVPDA